MDPYKEFFIIGYGFFRNAINSPPGVASSLLTLPLL